MNEQWRIILSIPAYEVSDQGRVRRLAQPGILRAYANHKGYLKLALFMGGRRFQRFVHRLVAEAFLGPIPEGHVVHHKDHDNQNNRHENLEYLLRSANTLDARYALVKRSPMGGIPEILVEAWVRGWAIRDLAACLEIDESRLKRWLLRQEAPNGRVTEISQRLWKLVIGQTATK